MNGTFETFGAVYAYFLHTEGFFESTKILLWFNEENGHPYVENMMENKSRHGLTLMRIRLNPDKLRYAKISEEHYFERYREFCDMYDICIPEPGTFATASEHGAELMDMLISDMTDSDFFLYAVESWKLWIDDVGENVLARALRKRKEQGTLPVWNMKSGDFLPE